MVFRGEVITVPDVNPVGWSLESRCTVASSPTSTSFVQVTGVSAGFTATGTSDVYLVHVDVDVSLTPASSRNVVELRVDGVADPEQIVMGAIPGVASSRLPGHHTFRLSGLAAGAHTLTMWTRSDGAYTTTVQATNSGLIVHRIA